MENDIITRQVEGEINLTSLSVETLGVIDFTAAKFTIFDRSGFNQNQEWQLGWLDKKRVAISTTGNIADLYVYKFE